MPRGPETQVYSIEGKTDLSLVGTAEITLGGLYKDQTVMADELPIRMCGISHCYRTEAGAAGRGLARTLSGSPVHESRDVRVYFARSK